MMLMNLRLAENELFTDLTGDLLICFVSPVLFKNCVLLGFMVSLNILVHNKDEAYIPCFTTQSELQPALLRGGDGGGLVLLMDQGRLGFQWGARRSCVGQFSRGW